jgi:hypothetical protein
VLLPVTALSRWVEAELHWATVRVAGAAALEATEGEKGHLRARDPSPRPSARAGWRAMVTQGASEPENYVPPTRDLEKRERSAAGSARVSARLPGLRLRVPAARVPQWLGLCQRARPACTHGTHFLAALRSECTTNWGNAALRQAFVRNRVPCVHMGWAFWRPPAREGWSCLKSRPACTHGAFASTVRFVMCRQLREYGSSVRRQPLRVLTRGVCCQGLRIDAKSLAAPPNAVPGSPLPAVGGYPSSCTTRMEVLACCCCSTSLSFYEFFFFHLSATRGLRLRSGCHGNGRPI